jgi:hypothetical protein
MDRTNKIKQALPVTTKNTFWIFLDDPNGKKQQKQILDNGPSWNSKYSHPHFAPNAFVAPGRFSPLCCPTNALELR